MFTLQILDRGQILLHPLGDQDVLIGGDPHADIRLDESGVALRHARIERTPGGYQLVAMAALRVNGKSVDSVPLALGDRIEIGRAVLVVGRTVARAARPEDVLDRGPRRLERRPVRRSARLVPLAVAGAVLAGAVWLAATAAGGGNVGGELAYVARLRTSAQLERANAEIRRLRDAWQGATDDRLLRLADEQDAIEAVEVARDRLVAAVVAADDRRSSNEWLKELLRLEQQGDDSERVAARVVRGQLAELLLQRTARPGPPGDGAAPTAEPFGEAEIQSLADQGLFAQALDLIQASQGDAPAAAVATALAAQRAAVLARADEALAALLADARAAAGDGRPERAVALLQDARHRFPSSARFAALAAELRRLELVADAAPASAPAPPPVAAATPAPAPAAATVAPAALDFAGLRAALEAVRRAEQRADFGAAAAQLRATAEQVRERDPDFAERLLVRAAHADLFAAWHTTAAAAAAPDQPLPLLLHDGHRVDLVGADGDGLLGASGGAPRRFSWDDVSGASLVALVQRLAPSGEAALGAAVLLYRSGEGSFAEKMLAELLRADQRLKQPVDRVIASGRGERPDGGGYVLRGDGFVAAREIEIGETAKKLARQLGVALAGKDASARDTFVATVMAGDPQVVKPLAIAARQALGDQIGKLDQGGLNKQLGRLRELRQRLDAAREHALELIYDEVRYFYPYKPPAVSGEQHAAYNRVQAEVDERVAAVRGLWEDRQTRVRVPASLAEDLSRVDWLLALLDRLGESGSHQAAAIEWARGLVPGETTGIQQFCLNARERGERQIWARVHEYNAAIGKQLSVAQRDLLRATNQYRMMLGRRPLAAVLTCCAASQGHADEMARLGYFAHMSPVDGRRTPQDRMRLAGYQFGVSENIAMTDGPFAAVSSWARSSGHHRNMLEAGHREIGVGGNGRYWVQNFGSGDVHRSDPAWPNALQR